MSELEMPTTANEVTSGVNAADAVPQEIPTARTKADEFSELINGEFKEEFGKRVGETVRARLKGRESAEKTVKTLEPILCELYKNFQIEDGKEEELVKAYQIELQKRQKILSERLVDNSPEYAELKELYPDFDLHSELKNEKFAQLLKIESISPLQAYELLHRDEIQKRALLNAEDAILKKIKARSLRPLENGAKCGNGVLQKKGVSSLSASDRDEIDKRVAKGEIIVL